jgi:hypothetical protein
MLYEVVIGNNGDDRNYSKLILSHEPLTDDSNLDLLQLDANLEFIIEVKKPTILINAWDVNEFNELKRILDKLTIL